MNPALVDRRRFLASLAGAPLLPRLAASSTGLRVAALDWALAETMLALGHTPIAIVNATDWNRFLAGSPLPPGVADLGLQPEINFELLASLKPDLILTSPFVEHLEPVFQRIAETWRLSVFEQGTVPLEHQRVLTRALAERLGRVEEARRFLDSAEHTFDSYRSRLAVLDPLPVLLVSFMDARHVRVYGGSGLYQNVLDRIGLANAWSGETNYWGYTTVGIERLATGTDLQLIAFEPIPGDALPTLQRSPLWSRLPFVRARRFTVLPPVRVFGAMPSALRFARLVMEHRAPR